jgi:hypothetical protein
MYEYAAASDEAANDQTENDESTRQIGRYPACCFNTKQGRRALGDRPDWPQRPSVFFCLAMSHE